MTKLDTTARVMPIGRHVPSGPITPPVYEVYRGDELADFAGRAGAMDAYKLPSRMLGCEVYPNREYKNEGPF